MIQSNKQPYGSDRVNPWPTSFRGKTVLVTGHTGFKGSWLCLWLSRLGANVIGYALEPPTHPSNFVVSNVESTLSAHHVADIRDRAKLSAVVRDTKPDVIFHLAAETVVRRSYEIPYETFEVNVLGTANLLDAVRDAGITKCAIVVVTSDKCYDNVGQVWGYRESDPLGGSDPYSASKAGTELVVRSYRDSFFNSKSREKNGVQIATARGGNVVGGGDWTRDALIVDILSALTSENEIVLRNPDAIRPWQHVLPALSGYLCLAASLMNSSAEALRSASGAGAWNFGPNPGNELPVHQIADRLIQLWGSGSWSKDRRDDNPHEATTLRLNIDKSVAELRWASYWDVFTSLEKTVEWFHEYIAENAMDQVCLRQIAEYEALLGAADLSSVQFRFAP